MSRDDYEAVLQEARRMLVRVDVRLVRDVVPVALEEAYEVVLRVERALRGVHERAIERDAHRVHQIRAVERVEALPAPRIVRLPCVDGHLHEDARVLRRRLADDEDDPAARIVVVAGARVAEERVVVAARRRRGNGVRVRHGPVGAKDAGLPPVPLALLLAAATRDARHQPRAETAVPAEAVDLDAIAIARRADVEMDRLPG